jgi:hypothetical protein
LLWVEVLRAGAARPAACARCAHRSLRRPTPQRSAAIARSPGAHYARFIANCTLLTGSSTGCAVAGHHPKPSPMSGVVGFRCGRPAPPPPQWSIGHCAHASCPTPDAPPTPGGPPGGAGRGGDAAAGRRVGVGGNRVDEPLRTRAGQGVCLRQEVSAWCSVCRGVLSRALEAWLVEGGGPARSEICPLPHDRSRYV